jgi:hypothetical protein
LSVADDGRRGFVAGRLDGEQCHLAATLSGLAARLV